MDFAAFLAKLGKTKPVMVAGDFNCVPLAGLSRLLPSAALTHRLICMDPMPLSRQLGVIYGLQAWVQQF